MEQKVRLSQDGCMDNLSDVISIQPINPTRISIYESEILNGSRRGFISVADAVGESFGPNVSAAQKAGKLTGTVGLITLTQEPVRRK